MLMAAYLINRMPSRILGFKSLVSVFSNHFPDSHITCKLTPKVFGCVNFVHIHAHNRGKLDQRALKCIFVGYCATKKGYKCYHPFSWKFFISMDVTFVERQFFFFTPYLQGQMTTIKDKDKDRFLLDLSLPSGSSGFTTPQQLLSSFVLPESFPATPSNN